MALFLVLEDFTGPATITAGSLIDSGAHDLPALQASGLAVLPYLSTMDGTIAAYLSQRGSTPPVKTAEGDLLALLAAGGFIGGGGGVTSVGATLPLLSSGGATPGISLTAGGLAGEVLTWNGSAWAGATPAAAGITALTGDVTASGAGSVAATVAKIQGYEVATAAPINGNVLAWSSAQSKWVPGAPAVGGGSGGVTLYLNGSTAATAPTTNLPVPSNVPGTIVQELGTTGQVAAANVQSNDLTQVPGAYDLVASFVSPPNSPGVTSVPAGLWNFNIWASSSGTANQTVMQVRVYKYDGAAVPTLLATSDDASIYDPAVISQYILTVVIPAGVTLLATDRLYVELRGRATNNNRRITFQFGDGEPTHVTTTLPSAAGGDLSGTFPSPTVAKLQGRAVSPTAPADGEVLTWDSGSSEWVPTAPSGGAVYAGALTVYVDPVNGTDAPGGGTLDAPYASINYAYSQVTSLGDVTNVVYNANVGQFVTEKLVFQLAPGRYVENVLLGFKRARVQLIGNGVQIIGTVTMRAVRADFPAASMEALKASFPAPYTGAGMLATFEITGQAGGGVEADATADPCVVTGLSTLLFDEPTVPGFIASGTAWDNNYGQFNFYANKANLIGGMVISTSYVTTPFRGLGACVIEIDGSTIGEASTPVRSYLGAVPYAYVANPTLWNTGTGVATGAQTSTTLQDTSKTWTVNQWVGATVLLTSGTGATQTRTVISNTATALTVAAWATTPVAASTVYSLITPAGTATGVQSSTTLQDTSKTWTVNQYAGASITLTGGTGAPQTRTIASNTADTLTVSAAWTTTPVSGSTTYSVAYQVPEGVITLKTHSSTLGASVGPRLTLGELDGCRIYDLDRTMLGTVDNGGVTGTGSSSYIGSVINQYRQYSGTGIPPSQYQLGSNLAGTRYKFDSTSYTTIAFNRSSTTGVLTARTLNLPTNTGTATAGAATTLTDTSKVWVTNRWAGGTLTLNTGTGSGQSRTISSNTATVITVSPAFSPAPAAGTTYTVTALAAFDFQDDSRSLAYTPTTGANWADPAPTTVQSALDRIASAVFVLRGSSAIP